LHLEKYYPAGHWGKRLDADELAELFIADIEVGIDENDYSGPDSHRTKHRAGVIKVAGGRDRLSAHEIKAFRAAALASRRTGCPIITHTEEGTAANEQVRLLIAEGVSPERIVISHTDRKPDIEYHRALLRTGVCLEYDSAFRWKAGVNHTANLVVSLAPEFPDQLLLGMDMARSSYWKSYGGSPGLTFLLTEFRLALTTAGLDDSYVQRMFVDNASRAYAFGAK
jgi:phosphotriesterase-related protein